MNGLGEYFRKIKEYLKEKALKFAIMLIYFFLAMWIVYIFVFYKGISVGKDAGAPIFINWDVFRNMWYTWYENPNLGVRGLGNFMIIFPAFISAILGPFLSAFLYNLLLYFISFLGSWLYFRYILLLVFYNNFKEKYIDISSFLASMIYFFSPIAVGYRFEDVFLGNTTAYYVTPLFLYLLLKIFNSHPFRKKIVYILLLFVLSWVFSLFTFLFIFSIPVFTIATLIYLTYNLIMYKIRPTIITAITVLIVLLSLYMPVVIILYLSSFFAINVIIGNAPPINTLKVSGELTQVSHVILIYVTHIGKGLSKFLGYFGSRYTMLWWFVFIINTFYLICIFLIKDKFLSKKQRLFILIFYTLFLASLTLTMLPNGPAGNIFKYLFSIYKPLWIFRYPYDKFNYFLMLFFATIFCLNIYYLLIYKIRRNTLKFIIITFVIITTFLTSYPLLSGIVTERHSKLKLSEEFLSDLQYIHLLSKKGKIFSYPPIQGPWIYTIFGYYGADYLINVVVNNYLGTNFKKINFYTRHIYKILGKNELSLQDLLLLQRDLNILNINFIVLRHDLNISKQSVFDKNIQIMYKNFNMLKQFFNLTLIKNLNYYEVYKYKKVQNIYIYEILSSINLVGNISWSPPSNKFAVNYSRNLIVIKTAIFKHVWDGLASSELSVIPKDVLLLKAWVKTYNTRDNYIVIDGFIRQKGWYRITNCSLGIHKKGIKNWTLFYCLIWVPNNVTKIKIILNGGSVLNPNISRVAITWIKDLKLYKLKMVGFKLKKINPTLWKAYVNTSKPFLLVFAEAYDPLWEARVYKDGKLVEKVRSIPVYGVINGFWIDQTGNLTIIIKYIPQDWFELGLKISGITFLALIVYLMVPERYWRKLFEKPKSKIKL